MRTTPPGSTIPTAELAAHLRITIARAARRLRQESGGDLGPTLGAALATVERFGPITPSQLAERERIRRPSATRIVAKLEQHGYLERHADPADGRSCLVRATDAGVAHLAEVRSRRTAFLARRLDGLGADDRETLERAATILEQLLEAADPVAAADPATSGAR
ncbi:Transcriptional regulator MarR family [Patulibacter medicamentivorans]|uniref:Transcriptional regulator MarR family n=1 Tax=Patulibacter medicamentivorans TaxID=1097667 RepID=H0E361_9ACTN|nr:MarR family transcriptional regulator [Patulibacter medicamentivorans]EHN11884.1 Transcriptional regulator MarR family [Patulibacter medicamentivorans]